MDEKEYATVRICTEIFAIWRGLSGIVGVALQIGKPLLKKMVKCGASTKRYREIVTELKHRKMPNGESVSNYYAALVKVIDKFYNPVKL